jgi:hypothetical protein
VANWTKIKDAKRGAVIEEDAPPMEVVNDLASLPGWKGIPLIEAVVEHPFFSKTGELIISEGFHPQAKVWYHPDPTLKIPDVPRHPTREEIEKAKTQLLVELYGDFPFRSDACKAHVLSALLLPFVRLMIDGPTPLHLFDAPTEGTGKTLLAQVTTMIPCGRPVDGMPECTQDEEWRKRLTATLLEAPPYLFLDNLNRWLDNGQLASAITGRSWKDRVLGVSKNVALPITCIWLASGNNVRLSRELIRRTLWTRLDAKTDTPWLRTDFRHPNLYQWVRENRASLLWAVLTLIQAWILAGRPLGKQTLGMFESWAQTIGGILDVAEIPGLLGNAADFRAAATDTVSEWREFVLTWWREHQNKPVGVADLYELATREKLLDGVFGDKGEKGGRMRLGWALTKAVDRIYGDYRVVRDTESHKGCQRYCLQLHGQAVSAGAKETPQQNAEDDNQGEWSA